MPRSPLSHSLRLLLSSNVSSYSLPLVSPLSPVVPVLPYPFRSGVVEGSNRSHVSPSITSLVSPHLLTYFCSLLSSLYFLPISCTSSYTSSPSFPSLPSHFFPSLTYRLSTFFSHLFISFLYPVFFYRHQIISLSLPFLTFPYITTITTTTTTSSSLAPIYFSLSTSLSAGLAM